MEWTGRPDAREKKVKQKQFIFINSINKKNMKTFINIFVFLLTLNSYAQTLQDYYVVAKPDKSIEPVQKTTLNDGSLALSFSQEELQTFFSNVSVYKYEKAFPNAVSTYLQRVYIVSLTDDTYLGSLINLNNVEYVELIHEGIPLFEPNDPYYVEGDIGYTYLKLVRANRAWDITTVNPNVIIGITDTGFDPNHEDMQGQFVGIIGNPATSDTHGISVSGFVSPKTNNGIGISGIGYNTKMYGANGLSTLKAYELAQIPGVRVINASWGSCSFSTVNQEVYNEIRNVHNVLVVAAAGNGDGNGDGLNITCGNPNNYLYPASYDNVLSVSSVGHRFPIGHPDFYNWADVHQVNTASTDPESWTHQHNDKVDIVAPGFDFRTTGYNNTYNYIWHGTSSSAPQVAAAAGLILSVNSNLTATQVENILKNTADDIYWIPYNEPYIGKLGTGRLNVFRAVKTTDCLDEQNPIVDFVIRDSEEDTGAEPNLNTEYMWTSTDIIVRNQNDGKLTPVNQNPIYDGINPNYIYVRVTNIGCQTSS